MGRKRKHFPGQMCDSCGIRSKATVGKLKDGTRKVGPYCVFCRADKWNFKKDPNHIFNQLVSAREYTKFKKQFCSTCGVIPEHSCQLDVRSYRWEPR